MRRLLPISILFVALVAGCGDDTDEGSGTSATADTESSVSTPSTDDAESTDTTESTETTDSDDTTESTGPADTTAVPDKPEVEIPAEQPTELVITDLIEGTGEPAAAGDTVEVFYVGVRSEDGEEFDNNYDSGTPYPVTLGQGSVIDGWEQGLLGVKAGGRRQLDIPAELAYGDTPREGGPIQPGDALSFVIDVVSVTPGVDVPTADPADKPDVEIATSEGATEVTFEDLVVGDGDEAAEGQVAYVQLIAYRGDTGEELNSTWETGQAAAIPLNEETIPGLVTGVTGMKVGGRRSIVIPPEEAFGPEGNPNLGLPADTDLIIVVDLVLVTDA